MKVININENSFEEEVLDEKKPVLVDFWAPWCGPCRMLVPIIEEIADENSDTLKVVKINIDENQNLAAKYEITSVPTLMLFEKGKPQKTTIGFQSKEKLLEFIKN